MAKNCDVQVVFASNVLHSIYTARALADANLLTRFVSPLLFPAEAQKWSRWVPMIAKRIVDSPIPEPRDQHALVESASRLLLRAPVREGIRLAAALAPYRTIRIDGSQPGVFHSHSGYFSSQAARLRRKRWFIVCDHRSNYPGWNGVGGDAMRWRKEFDGADLVLVPSELARRSMIDAGVAENKVVALPLGVDLNRFAPCESLAPKGQSPIVMFVGRVTEPKGALVLARAAAMLPECRLMYVGPVDSRMSAEITRYVPDAVFTGQLDQRSLVQQYSAASVVVLPSFSDSFGLAPLEALACGKPVVVTEACGVSDLVASWRVGAVVPAGDASSLAGGIRRTLSCALSDGDMKQRSLKAAAASSWAEYQRALIELYERRVLSEFHERGGRSE